MSVIELLIIIMYYYNNTCVEYFFIGFVHFFKSQDKLYKNKDYISYTYSTHLS